MVRRSVLLLIVLVAVAGCSGPNSVGDGTTPIADSTAADEKPYPAGVSDDGVNASAVAAAHERALQNRSVTVVVEWRDVRSNGEEIYRVETYATGDRRSYLHRYRFSHVNDEWTTYHNETSYLHDGFVYERIDASMENTSYHLSERTLDESSLVGTDSVNETLSAADFAPAERQNGSDLVLRATVDDLPDEERENLTAYNATVRIHPDGFVRSVEINSTTVEAGEQVERCHKVRVTDVGTTDVPEPAWFDEARSTLSNPIEPPKVPAEDSFDFEDDYESGSVVSYELGAAATLVGGSDLIETASIAEWGHAFAQEPLPSYAVSTPVQIRADAPAEGATIKLRYDESAIPDGDESGLAVYRFNHTMQTFVPLESSVDPANDTVTAQGRDVLDEYEYGDETYLSAFAVFHVASWEAMWETDAPGGESESIAEGVTLETGVEPPADVEGVERARVSSYVYFDPGPNPGDATLTIEYDESAIPDGKEEARLGIYRYDESENTYRYVNSTLHLRDDVATAEPTESGTYVVLHTGTWRSEDDE